MANELRKTCEHILELHPGDEGEIELRLATNEGTTLSVGLAAVDPSAGKAELVFDDMWGAYQMHRFAKDEDRWMSIRPGEDGAVHAVVDFGAGEHVNISSDFARIHSLDLTEIAWHGGRLRLTFLEAA